MATPRDDDARLASLAGQPRPSIGAYLRSPTQIVRDTDAAIRRLEALLSIIREALDDADLERAEDALDCVSDYVDEIQKGIDHRRPNEAKRAPDRSGPQS